MTRGASTVFGVGASNDYPSHEWNHLRVSGVRRSKVRRSNVGAQASVLGREEGQLGGGVTSGLGRGYKD